MVVVGTDGSATASEAVRRAADIVRTRGGRLHLVTAVDALRRWPDAGDVPEEFRAIAESQGLLADRILELAASGPAKGVAALTHPEHGDVIEALTRVAEKVAADLIVVGNQRPAMMPKFIAGSIADRLVHHARCDVLVVNTDVAAA